MALIRGRTKAGTNKQVRKGAVASSDMKNGEEVLQYHRGRLKLIRKEFGKIFELEFSSPEMRELKTFAKYSDVKRPHQNNRVFTTVVLDLAEDKFVNLTQTFFNKKDHYV